jgi:hypothetical protein
MLGILSWRLKMKLIDELIDFFTPKCKHCGLEVTEDDGMIIPLGEAVHYRCICEKGQVRP